MHQDIDDVDLLSPQIREMYNSLVVTGHYDDAQDLIEKATNGLVSDDDTGYEYITQKEITAKNLLIHLIAKSLEHQCCTRATRPCNLCLSEARKIAPTIWQPIFSLMKYMEKHSGLTIFQILETFIKEVQSDPGERIEALHMIQSGLKIIKAPKLGE